MSNAQSRIGGERSRSRSRNPTPSEAASASGVVRYSPELPYRPRVSPPSVEDKDACAIYASVSKDATPSHRPVARAIPALQKMLHRAGNVDGEGDGIVVATTRLRGRGRRRRSG